MTKRKDLWPRCEELLKDSSECNRAVAKNADGEPETYCAHHLKTSAAEVAGNDSAVTSASGVTPPSGDAAFPSVPAEDLPSDEPEPERESAPIASIRAALRDDLLSSETADAVRELLLEALRSSKTVYVTCSSCGKRSPAQVPDLAGRVSAATALMDQIEGRLAQATAQTPETSDRRQLEDLSWDELQILLAEGTDRDPSVDWLTADIAAAARRIVRELDERALAEEMAP